MCDYSLEMYRTKPARAGERYVTTRFATGTMGLASAGDPTTPICVQCDTRLRLDGIPDELQRTLGVGATEEVVFTRLDQGYFRDGIRFANGAELSLQRLPPGIDTTVTMTLGQAQAPFRAPETVW